MRKMNKKLPTEIMHYIRNFILKSVSHKVQPIIHRTVIMVKTNFEPKEAWLPSAEERHMSPNYAVKCLNRLFKQQVNLSVFTVQSNTALKSFLLLTVAAGMLELSVLRDTHQQSQ